MTSQQKFINSFLTLNYDQIKQFVQYKAFKFYINQDDLLNEFNHSICRIYAKSSFDGAPEQFWAYIHAAIHTSAVNVKKRNRGEMENDIEDMRDTYTHTVSEQPDINLKLLTREVCEKLPASFKTSRQQIVWNAYFIEGYTYETIAAIAGIPLGTVKNIIFKIREKANDKWGKPYREAI